ncbi:hypothetical protein D3C78_1530570 [compost metagenome]
MRLGDRRGQRGKALGLAAFDFGAGAGDQVARFAQFGAVIFGRLQGGLFAHGHPWPGHLQIGQPVARGRVVEVAREAGLGVHALGLQPMLLGQGAGLARGGPAQIIAAHGAQFGAALFDMG